MPVFKPSGGVTVRAQWWRSRAGRRSPYAGGALLAPVSTSARATVASARRRLSDCGEVGALPCSKVIVDCSEATQSRVVSDIREASLPQLSIHPFGTSVAPHPGTNRRHPRHPRHRRHPRQQRHRRGSGFFAPHWCTPALGYGRRSQPRASSGPRTAYPGQLGVPPAWHRDAATSRRGCTMTPLFRTQLATRLAARVGRRRSDAVPGTQDWARH